jgi:SRSO17 transposase
VPPAPVLADSAYGNETRFREGITELELQYARPGRTRTITDATVKRVIEKTTREKPDNATQWSTRTMAVAVGLSEASVRRI